MKLNNILWIIAGLFIAQKWADGRQAAKMSETMNTDVYGGVTDIWETLNGKNFDGNPNAHPAYVELTGGQPGLSKVGVL